MRARERRIVTERAERRASASVSTDDGGGGGGGDAVRPDERLESRAMSDSSDGLIDFAASIGGGLKRCGAGMSSPALSADGIGVAGGLPRTMSTSALRVRPARRALFWEQCFETASKRDL